MANGAPRSLPRSPYVAGRGRRTCLRTSARALAHSRWACPRPVQASLAVATTQNAGLCHAEAQRITLLATVASSSTLDAIR